MLYTICMMLYTLPTSCTQEDAVWRRTAQGSRAGPLSFFLFIVLIMRLTQGVVGKLRSSTRRVPHRGSGACYVDDLIFAIRGSMADIERSVTHIMCCWLAVNLPLAFPKGAFGVVRRGRIVLSRTTPKAPYGKGTW